MFYNTADVVGNTIYWGLVQEPVLPLATTTFSTFSVSGERPILIAASNILQGSYLIIFRVSFLFYILF